MPRPKLIHYPTPERATRAATPFRERLTIHSASASRNTLLPTRRLATVVDPGLHRTRSAHLTHQPRDRVDRGHRPGTLPSGLRPINRAGADRRHPPPDRGARAASPRACCLARGTVCARGEIQGNIRAVSGVSIAPLLRPSSAPPPHDSADKASVCDPFSPKSPAYETEIIVAEQE